MTKLAPAPTWVLEDSDFNKMPLAFGGIDDFQLFFQVKRYRQDTLKMHTNYRLQLRKCSIYPSNMSDIVPGTISAKRHKKCHKHDLTVADGQTDGRTQAPKPLFGAFPRRKMVSKGGGGTQMNSNLAKSSQPQINSNPDESTRFRL